MKQRLKLGDTINDPTNVESKTQIKQNDPLSQNDKTGSSLIKILYGNGDLTNSMLPSLPFFIHQQKQKTIQDKAKTYETIPCN